MAETVEPDAAPGWYADPDQARTLRYWDGRRWTSQHALIESSTPSSEKRERTRREGKCQLCEKAVPMAKQKTLINDLESGKVRVVRAIAGKSHYCNDCTATRKQMKEAWMERRGTGADQRGQSSGGAKKATQGKGKTGKANPKGKAAKRPPAKKKATKKAPKKVAAKGDEPF